MKKKSLLDIQQSIDSADNYIIKSISTIEKDNDYEMFLLQKEDGGNFYSKDLFKKINARYQESHTLRGNYEDIFCQVAILQEDHANKMCQFIKHCLKRSIDKWMQSAKDYMTDACVKSVYTVLISLLLAADKTNCVANKRSKTSLSYFKDFQNALRSLLHNKNYVTLLKNNNDFYKKTAVLVEDICFCIFTCKYSFDALYKGFSRILSSQKLEEWEYLEDIYQNILNYCKQIPNGPLFKILDLICLSQKFFDPYMQNDLPNIFFTLSNTCRDVDIVCLPTPTLQTQIESVWVIPEFLSFLGRAKANDKKVLLISLEDNSQWRSCKRVKALMDIQNIDNLSNTISVFNLSRNSDFYFQKNKYSNLSDSSFKKHIVEYVKDSNSQSNLLLNKEILEFIDQCTTVVDQFFFDKNISSHGQRLIFIDIFYTLFTIKLMEVSNADYVMISGKDGNDAISFDISMLYVTISYLIGQRPTKENVVSFAFLRTLISRERCVSDHVVERFINTCQFVRIVCKKKGMDNIKSLYKGIFKDAKID